MSFARAEKRRREREAARFESAAARRADDRQGGALLDAELRRLLEPDEHGMVRAIGIEIPVDFGR